MLHYMLYIINTVIMAEGFPQSLTAMLFSVLLKHQIIHLIMSMKEYTGVTSS